MTHRSNFLFTIADQQRVDWGGLCDLETDPQETLNLWDDPDCAVIKGSLSLSRGPAPDGTNGRKPPCGAHRLKASKTVTERKETR